MSAHDLETKILAVLRGLSYAGSPVKARTIVRILCDQFGEGFYRRQINPVLYRMRAEGKVSRDEYFRWSFRENSLQNPQGLVRNAYSNRAPSELRSVFQKSSSTAAPRPKPQTQRPSTELIPAPGNITSARTTAASESQQKTNFAPVTSGPFTVAQETAGYERYCEWCSAKIGAKMPSVVVRSDGKHRTKFCGEECWQNWESIYWQRTALKRLQLTREAFRREQRLITRQKHFLGYGW
jgi:hypothetical protein